jgi:hypothetical protein
MSMLIKSELFVLYLNWLVNLVFYVRKKNIIVNLNYYALKIYWQYCPTLALRKKKLHHKKKKKMKKSILKRIWIGMKKGVATPNLPQEFLKFHLNPFIRVLRVICGLSWVTLMGGKLVAMPLIIITIAVFFTTLHFFYIWYVSYIKIKYMIEVLKSDKLDVRN